MTRFSELAASVARHLSRDDARKGTIIAANPEHFYAMDAGDVDAMSATEAAASVLAKRGVRLNTGEDAERMLAVHNMGVDYGRARVRDGGASGSWGADASEPPADNPISRYIRGES